MLMHRFKYHSALIFDSAAAFFGRDNVGLCGVAHFFKVTCRSHRPHFSDSLIIPGKVPEM